MAPASAKSQAFFQPPKAQPSDAPPMAPGRNNPTSQGSIPMTAMIVRPIPKPMAPKILNLATVLIFPVLVPTCKKQSIL